MAKRHSNPHSDAWNPQRGPQRPDDAPSPSAADEEASRLAPPEEADTGLDDLEERLTDEPVSSGDLETAGAGGEGAEDLSDGSDVSDVSDIERRGEYGAGAGAAETPVKGGGVARVKTGGGLGMSEWVALGGFALIVVVSGILFLKYLYAHAAPIQGTRELQVFSLPMAGPAVRLIGAEVAWRDRAEGDVARLTESVIPTIILRLDPNHTSTGFVRVEFVDSEDRIRGDVMIMALEGGRFKEGGRGDVIEEGGLKVQLTGTVGFRTQALFASYLSNEEPRWSVRVKEGPDYADGPWTDLGVASIPNKRL